MTYMKVPVSKARDLFLYFAIYSFVGWCLETAYVSITTGRFMNRGFLVGPFCPVYGFGALLLLVSLHPVRKKTCLLFMGAILFTTLLEYFTGFLLEELFGCVLWDYSRELFNIKGWICLKFSLVWGICAVVILRYLHPRMEIWLKEFHFNTRTIITCILILYFVLDFTATVASSISPNLGNSIPASILIEIRTRMHNLPVNLPCSQEKTVRTEKL
jgi:uncharacterized membrane protein